MHFHEPFQIQLESVGLKEKFNGSRELSSDKAISFVQLTSKKWNTEGFRFSPVLLAGILSLSRTRARVSRASWCL